MKKHLIFILFASLFVTTNAQEFIPLWSPGHIPNSRGLVLKDSMNAELIYQVSIPGVYAFRPSNLENKGAAVLIVPSGGYAVLSYATGFQLAKWFNTIGITAFVLKYRLPQSPDVIESYKAPLQDAQRAMKLVRSKAKQWGYNASKVGVMGASSGGHIAACLSTIYESWYTRVDSVDINNSNPNFTMLISPVISMSDAVHIHSRNNLFGKDVSPGLTEKLSCQWNVSKQTPPAFIVHAANDNTVSPFNSILYYTSLVKNGIEGSSLHIFPTGDHSIRVRKNPGTSALWPALAENWLIEIGMLLND